jgi:2-polyprenyl-6-methoxyphenol hydroxylase-like FAD-dependent oxidoreductase
MYAPRRTVLDALVVDAARLAGATVEFGATVTGLTRSSDGGVNGVVIGGRRTGTDRGAPRIEHAPLVVGADGRNSLVARLTGAGIGVVQPRESSYLYGYWADFPSDGYEWFYRPGLTAGAIPTNAGLTCVFVGAPPARIHQLVSERSPLHAFSSLAGPVGIGGRIGSAVLAEPVRYVRALPPAYLRTCYGAGWALVGDAGHWMDPISTHGITAAFRDAELLAQAVLSAGGLDRLSALAGYQAVRNRLSDPMIRVSEEIAGYRWDLERIRTLLRSLASAMADEVETLSALAPAA